MGLDNYGSRTIAYCRDDKPERSKTFWSIYLFQAAASLVSLAVYVAAVGFFFRDHMLIYWMQLLYVLSVLFDVTWLFYGLEKFRLATLRSLASRALLIAGVFLFVREENDLWIYTLVMAASFLLEQALLFPFLFRVVHWVRPARADIARHIRPNLRLFIPILAVSVYNWMNKILLGVMDGSASVAYYSYAESIVNLPKGILTALGAVTLPKISHMLANRQADACRRTLRESIRLTSFISCALSFGIAGLSPVFVPFFLGPDYMPTIWLTVCLAILMVPMSLSDVIQMQYLIPFQLDSVFIRSVTLGAAVNIVLNLLLIPPLRAMGAAIAAIGAGLAVCVFQLVKIRSVYTAGELLRVLSPFMGIGAAEFAVTFAMSNLALRPILLLALQIAAGGSLYLLGSLVYFKLTGKGVSVLDGLWKNTDDEGVSDDTLSGGGESA